MTKREVDVTVDLSVIVEGDKPFDARKEVALRVKEAVEQIDGKTDGVAVGTRGGEEVDPEESAL